MDDFYKIGKIGRPHGISGKVLMTFTDDIFDTTDADHLMLMVDGLLVPFFMEEYRFRSDETAIVKFEGIDSKEQAAAITNCEIFFPRQTAEERGDFSLSQLVGYSIITKGRTVGTIRNIDTSTENYLFEVRSAECRVQSAELAAHDANSAQTNSALCTLHSALNYDQILIPIVDEWIEDIDHSTHTITLNLPEGLL